MEAQETPEGLILSVRVKPGSGRFSLTERGDDAVLELASPPREGQANQELVRELSRLLRCEVRILSGLRSRRKLILLRGITEKDLELALEAR
jgi:uncharacterized protein (TIGR00251 family)